MNLKRIFLLTIATLSLGGSLYGMGEQRDGYGRLTYFHGLETITCEHPFYFFYFVKENNLEKIKLIIQKNPDIVNVMDHFNLTGTALDFAIRENNAALVEILLTSNKRIEVNSTKTNRLHDAIITDYINDDEVDKQKQIIHLLCSAGVNLDTKCYNNKKDIINIIKTHINTRLAIAIKNGNAKEVEQLLNEYDIDINKPLSCYNYYLLPGATKKPDEETFIPLHMAASYKKHEIVCMLVNEWDADVHSRDIDGKTAFFGEPLAETARFLISKGGTAKACSNDGQRPIDTIRWALSPEGLDELRGQPEKIANLRALEEIFEGRSNNSWKWIGGGAAVIVACVAAKKLYNWWYKEAEVEKEKTKADNENNELTKDTVKDNAATQV